eukprot:scaffold221_cov351-Pavlova_lutheri.AAC.5
MPVASTSGSPLGWDCAWSRRERRVETRTEVKAVDVRYRALPTVRVVPFASGRVGARTRPGTSFSLDLVWVRPLVGVSLSFHRRFDPIGSRVFSSSMERSRVALRHPYRAIRFPSDVRVPRRWFVSARASFLFVAFVVRPPSRRMHEISGMDLASSMGFTSHSFSRIPSAFRCVPARVLRGVRRTWYFFSLLLRVGSRTAPSRAGWRRFLSLCTPLHRRPLVHSSLLDRSLGSSWARDTPSRIPPHARHRPPGVRFLPSFLRSLGWRTHGPVCVSSSISCGCPSVPAPVGSWRVSRSSPSSTVPVPVCVSVCVGVWAMGSIG